MIVRMIWPDHRPLGAGAGDAFWLECRAAEVASLVLSAAAGERRAELERDVADIIARAKARIAAYDRERAEDGPSEDGTTELMPNETEWRRYGGDEDPWVCFLVSRDGAVIEAHPWNYPFSGLWNAYSPLRAIPAVVVATLADLRAIVPPDEDPPRR